MQHITKKDVKTSRSRKPAAIIALMLVIAMLMTGTFAWSSISQRATNPDEGQNYPGGRVHDHFDRESGNKNVFAENFGDSPIFARILLLEFMELNNVIFGEGADRDDPTTWARHIPAPNDPSWNSNAQNGRFRDYVTWNMGQTSWFMPTFNQATQGGPYLQTDTSGDGIDWIYGNGSTAVGAPGQTAAWQRWVNDPTHADAVTDNTHPMYGYRPTGEFNDGTQGFWGEGDAAFEYLWYNPVDPVTGEVLPPVQSAERVRHDAQQNGPQDFAVRTMQQWIDAGRPAGDFWVIDTDGWAYWAAPLQPGATTANLLESIRNIRPAGQWYYAIHVVGEFASEQSLNDWNYSDWGAPSQEAGRIFARRATTVDVTNPAGTVLLPNAPIDWSGNGPSVNLGNGFELICRDEDGRFNDAVVVFGSYRQTYTGNTEIYQGSGQPSTSFAIEALTWLLLDINHEDGSALLITEYIINNTQFSLTRTNGNDYTTSNIRSWLNSEGGVNTRGNSVGFLDQAFTTAERARILPTFTTAADDGAAMASHGTTHPDGHFRMFTPTQPAIVSGDLVFILSLSETWALFGHRSSNPTGQHTNAAASTSIYANSIGAHSGSTRMGHWWLRTEGWEAERASNVGSGSDLGVNRASSDRNVGVRPAINVSIDLED